MTSNSMIKNVAQGVGALVWWDLDNSRIAPGALRDLLDAHNLAHIEVPDVDNGQVLRDVARTWTKGRGHEDRYRSDVVHVERTDTTHVVTVGVQRRTRRAAKQVDWEQVDTVVFDVVGDQFISLGSTAEAAEFVEVARRGFDVLDYRFLTPKVIKSELDRMFAIHLRRQGGVEYVAAHHLTHLDDLKAVVDGVGDCTMSIVHVEDTESSRQSIGRGVNTQLHENLAGLIASLDAWEQGARRPQTASLSAMFDEFKSLRSQAEMYSDVLQMKVDDLADALTGAEERARRVIAGIGAAPVGEDGHKFPAVSKVVDALRTAYDVAARDPDGTAHLDDDAMAAAGLSKVYRTNPGVWQNNRGSSSAYAIGLTSTMSKRGGVYTLHLTPIDGWTPSDAESVAPRATGDAAEPAAETVVAPPAANPTPGDDDGAPQTDDDGQPDEAPTPEPTVEIDPEFDDANGPTLEEMTVDELRKEARGYNVTGVAKMKKPELLDAIRATRYARA